ncbi:MAG: 2-amino-4-hydroxy-6-hydroxymethyldihydropteridine diphosphokinase [Verrucomicrobiota bacterium]|nr:2-amino-4-hydroxy-6-hydroxymethyldihydropteridine diphosphokinase [Verrucomicrobiota bacterium]
MRAGVALGANLGDRLTTLRAARERIRRLPEVRPPIISSTIYETEPIGCEPGATPFLNAVVEFDFDGDPAGLLRELRGVEIAFGREAEHEPNRSRTLDLDLLYCGDREVQTAALQLPHSRIGERRFVLEPLADLRPELVLPGLTSPVKTMLAELPASPAVVRSREQW